MGKLFRLRETLRSMYPIFMQFFYNLSQNDECIVLNKKLIEVFLTDLVRMLMWEAEARVRAGEHEKALSISRPSLRARQHRGKLRVGWKCTVPSGNSERQRNVSSKASKAWSLKPFRNLEI